MYTTECAVAMINVDSIVEFYWRSKPWKLSLILINKYTVRKSFLEQQAKN